MSWSTGFEKVESEGALSLVKNLKMPDYEENEHAREQLEIAKDAAEKCLAAIREPFITCTLSGHSHREGDASDSISVVMWGNS